MFPKVTDIPKIPKMWFPLISDGVIKLRQLMETTGTGELVLLGRWTLEFVASMEF
jgi:hypothetical protein